jgi:CheY-like chemotaxis protein
VEWSLADTVLIVDDDRGIRRSLHQVLGDEGFAIAEAGNGQEALARLSQAPLPAVILLDLMMPVMDGYTLSRRLRDEPVLSQIPIIVVTAGGNCAEVKNQIAVRDCLHKPIDLNRLLASVSRFASTT